MPAVKPLWIAGPESIDPDWLWAWEGLVACVPFLAPGDAIEIVSGVRGSLITGGQYILTPYGTAWDTRTTAGRMRFQIPGIPTGDTEMSVFLIGDIEEAGPIMTFRVDAFADEYDLGIDPVGEKEWRFNGAIAPSTWPGNGLHSIGVAREVGGLTTFVTNGDKVETATGGSSLGDGSNPSNILLGGAGETDLTGTAAATILVYVWDRVLSSEQLRAIGNDPYGPIRPVMWEPWMADTASSVSLYATADGTITTLVDEADLTVNLYTSIDDDPATPTDTDWVNNSTGTGQGFFDVTDVPADFGTADTAEIVARYRGQNFGTGTVTLYAQLFQSDESTSLSNEVQVAQVTGNGSFANTTVVSFTGLNTTAGKSVWDAARVRLRWATT